jgi:hypothetical protein
VEANERNMNEEVKGRENGLEFRNKCMRTIKRKCKQIFPPIKQLD